MLGAAGGAIEQGRGDGSIGGGLEDAITELNLVTPAGIPVVHAFGRGTAVCRTVIGSIVGVDGVEGAVGGGVALTLDGDDAVLRGLQIIRVIGVRDGVGSRNLGDITATGGGAGETPRGEIDADGDTDLREGGERGGGGGVVDEVQFIEEDFAGDAGVHPEVGGEEVAVDLGVTFGEGGVVGVADFLVEAAGEVPRGLLVVGGVDDGHVPLGGLGAIGVQLGALVDGPDDVADEGVLGEAGNARAGEVAVEVGVAGGTGLELELDGVRARPIGILADLGGGGLIEPSGDGPGVGGRRPTVDGALRGTVEGIVEDVLVGIGGVAEGGGIGGLVGEEDADGVVLHELTVADGGADAEDGRAGDGLGERRGGDERVGIVGAGDVGEGDVRNAEVGGDGVADGEAVDKDAAIATVIAFRRVGRGGGDPEAQAADVAVGEGDTLGEGDLGEVGLVDGVDGVGDVDVGEDGEVAGLQVLEICRGGGAGDVEADGGHVRRGEARGKGDTADTGASLQEGRIDVGVGELLGDNVVELEGGGEGGLLGEGVLGQGVAVLGEERVGGLAVLPIEEVDGGVGEAGIAGGPGGEDALAVVRDDDIVEVDVGVVGVIAVGGDDHDQTEGAAPPPVIADNFLVIDARGDGDGGPLTGEVVQHDGVRGIDPARGGIAFVRQEVGVLTGSAIILQYEGDGLGGATLARGDAVIEGDGAIADVAPGEVEGQRGIGGSRTVDSRLGVRGVPAGALHQEDLLAGVAPLIDVDFGIVARAHPDADGGEAGPGGVAGEALVGVGGDARLAIAVFVIAAPGGDGDIIDEDAGHIARVSGGAGDGKVCVGAAKGDGGGGHRAELSLQRSGYDRLSSAGEDEVQLAGLGGGRPIAGEANRAAARLALSGPASAPRRRIGQGGLFEGGLGTDAMAAEGVHRRIPRPQVAEGGGAFRRADGKIEAILRNGDAVALV